MYTLHIQETNCFEGDIILETLHRTPNTSNPYFQRANTSFPVCVFLLLHEPYFNQGTIDMGVL